MKKIDYKTFNKIVNNLKNNCYTNQPNYENGWSGDEYDIDEDTKILVSVCHAGWNKGKWDVTVWGENIYLKYVEKDKHAIIIFDDDCKSLYDIWNKGFN